MEYLVDKLSFMFWLMLALGFLYVGPFVLVYVPWRLLRDVRRIADGIEASNLAQGVLPAPLAAPQIAVCVGADATGANEASPQTPFHRTLVERQRRRISLSAFGR